MAAAVLRLLSYDHDNTSSWVTSGADRAAVSAIAPRTRPDDDRLSRIDAVYYRSGFAPTKTAPPVAAMTHHRDGGRAPNAAASAAPRRRSRRSPRGVGVGKSISIVCLTRAASAQLPAPHSMDQAEHLPLRATGTCPQGDRPPTWTGPLLTSISAPKGCQPDEREVGTFKAQLPPMKEVDAIVSRVDDVAASKGRLKLAPARCSTCIGVGLDLRTRR